MKQSRKFIERFIKYTMYNEIIKNLEIRPLSCCDDLKIVADLIYYSDNYIYPYLFGNDISVAEKVLSRMIMGDTIYNYKNIRIAVSSEQIIAMVVTKEVPIKVNYEGMLNSFVEAAVPVGAAFAKVFNEYFKLLEDEPRDIYIANIAVDKMFRGMGVGKVLLQSIFDGKSTYHLEVVQANKAAIALYKKLGFTIDYGYAGFTGVPCYRMSKKN